MAKPRDDGRRLERAPRRGRLRPLPMPLAGAMRQSQGRDRTLKRLLYDLIKAAETTGASEVVDAAIRLRSVLVEIGHDV